MNNSAGGNQQKAGAGTLGGCIQTAPANLTVGAVGFGPAWSDGLYEQAREAGVCTACGMADSMAASIVRLECEAEELRAEVALLREQARLLQAERDEARIQYRSTHALAEVLAKTQVKLKAERDEARALLEASK